MIKKGIAFLFYGVGVATILIYKEPILLWLSHGGLERLPWMIGAAIFLGMIPVIPFGIIAGIMGAGYGPVWGSVINVASSTAAAALTFWSIRVLFQERGRQLMASIKGLDRFILLLERNAFLAIIMARLLPFVPAIAINVVAAITCMSFGSFIVATVVGKIPVMIVFAFIGSQLYSSWTRMLWTMLIYMFFLIIVYACYRWWIHLMEPANEK